jgi:SNF2 family DNA or RNA helicase
MEYLIPPWAHQLRCIEAAKSLPCYALFFEMGAGKSSTLINIFRHKCNTQKKFLRTLILCPPIVIDKWKDEFLKHSRVQPGQVVLLNGSGKDRLKKFNKHKDQPCIFVTNYESLLMEDLFAALMAWQPEFLCVDESHRCKDYKAKRSKRVHKLANPDPKDPMRKPYTYLLSGSPVLNSPMDIFHQFKIMDGGKTFGDNFFVFRARHFFDKNAGMPKLRYFPKWELLPGALERINDAIRPVSMRVEKKECLDLPPMVYKTIRVEMGKEQRELYDSMKKDLIAVLNDKACVATLAITKALRLQQIASGYIKVVGDEEIPIKDNPKLAALEELLTELTPKHKVLVWAVFKRNYTEIKRLCERMGLKYVEVHGEISERGKQEAVEQFNTDGSVRVFIGHPLSGGIGIDLVSASYSIFYSRNFSLEQSLQAEARNYRGGTKEAGHEKITRVDLVCKDSIDELVAESLAKKEEVGLKVLQNLKGDL